MPRKRIDLRVLPVWLQYFISLTIVAVIVAAAWVVGHGQLVPAWVTDYLVPCLGWGFIILLIIGIAGRLLRR